jgi:hypothetical protein
MLEGVLKTSLLPQYNSPTIACSSFDDLQHVNINKLKTMAIDRRYQSGKINRCSCGKVILHVETVKKKSKSSSETQREPSKGAKGLRVFSSFIKKNDKKAHAAGCDLLSATGPKQKKKLCIECAKKPESEREPKRSATERLHRVKVASSLTKTTFAKKNGNSRTGLLSSLPHEIIVIDEDRPLPNTTVATPITNPSFSNFHSARSEHGFSPPTTMKRKPENFTFDFVSFSASSTDESLFAMSTEDKYSTILTDLAESEAPSTQKVGEAAIVPFLAQESGQSHVPQNLLASTEVPERARLVSEDSDITSIEFSEADFFKNSEMTSIELSEAEFMKICTRLDHCALQSPLNSTKADPDTNYVVPSYVHNEDKVARTTEVAQPSQFASWCDFKVKDFFVVS